jgi:hypothetical protein
MAEKAKDKNASETIANSVKIIREKLLTKLPDRLFS